MFVVLRGLMSYILHLSQMPDAATPLWVVSFPNLLSRNILISGVVPPQAWCCIMGLIHCLWLQLGFVRSLPADSALQ